MNKKLTPKQELFVREFLVDLNGTRAAERAGYSARTARKQASRLLTNVDIQHAIAEATQTRNERLDADGNYVLQRLLSIDQMSVADIFYDDGSIKPIREWPPVWQRYVSSIDVTEIWEGSGDERKLAGLLKKIRWPDKLRNLELLGKHTDVQAWKERSEVELDLPVVFVHDPEKGTYRTSDPDEIDGVKN